MPNVALIVLAVLLGLPAVYFGYDLYKKRKLKKWLRANWGTDAALRKPDDELVDDIADYWRAARAHQDAGSDVDDTTWSDLDMNQVLRAVDRSRSIVGSETLYAVLRRQGAAEEQLLQRDAVVEAYRMDEPLRLSTQMALHGIGYRPFHGASRYLYSPAYQYPPHRWLYRLLGLLPLTVMLLGLLVDKRLLLGVIGAFALNLLVYYGTQKTWEKELASIRHIGAVLRAAQRLAKERSPAFQAYTGELKPLLSRLRAIRRWLPMFGMEAVGDAEAILDYLKIFFMLDMVSLGAIVGELNKRGDEVRRLYALVGEADACLSIAQLWDTQPRLCKPQFVQPAAFSGQSLCHPLLKQCVPNDFHWQRNTLISGSNASGKSTFIKAVAINCILAQTLHCCWADSLSMCRGSVMSSMAVRDNIMDGESYFIVELKSLQRILNAAAQGTMIYCFVDEILRGTNTIERIAASAAVLRSLSGEELLCMTATHDIELTRMLEDTYDNRHFSERVGEEGVSFDFLLKEGPTRTRNALRLLRQMGYHESIVNHAEENAALFEQTGQWPRQ